MRSIFFFCENVLGEQLVTYAKSAKKTGAVSRDEKSQYLQGREGKAEGEGGEMMAYWVHVPSAG